MNSTTIQLSLPTLKPQKASFNHISKTTTWHGSQFSSPPQHRLHPFFLTRLQQPQALHAKPQDRLKKISLLASTSGNAYLPMNYWSFGVFLKKTSTHVIHFSGGMGDVPSSQISLALHAISSPFQVEVLSLSQFIFIINVLFVTGSAVAVERIFSGGRDTISLRRASLKPETIRMLMIVKRKLIHAREKIKSKLRRL
jgi:hypothetical protein